MRIGIITVYYSENSGSLLQAISLEKKLKSLGNEVFFINTKNKYSSHSFKLLLGRIVKELLKLNFSNVKNAIGKYYKYKKDIKRFNTLNLNEINNKNIDLLIIGSDTVWDIESQYFKESLKVFLPKTNNIPIVSYAASVGNTSSESFQKNNYAIEALEELKEITVRDEYSKSVLSKLINKNISIVSDPTIMVGRKSFDEFLYEINDSNYLLIYSFNDFEKSLIKEIKELAISEGLKIISIGKKYDWTDKNVISSLNSFITYYNSAKYVITNTFHGNVFSILFNRQFVNVDFGKKKVNKLLEHYNLTDRIYKNNESSIKDMFNSEIDYSEVNKMLNTDKNIADETIKHLLNNK